LQWSNIQNAPRQDSFVLSLVRDWDLFGIAGFGIRVLGPLRMLAAPECALPHHGAPLALHPGAWKSRGLKL